MVHRGRRTIVVTVVPTAIGRWAVGAVETARDVQSLSGVFDDHAHADLGIHASLAHAIRHTEQYAAIWKSHGSAAAGRYLLKCGCHPIGAKDLQAPVPRRHTRRRA
jgi:hypothetical protein